MTRNQITLTHLCPLAKATTLIVILVVEAIEVEHRYQYPITLYFTLIKRSSMEVLSLATPEKVDK